MPLYKSDSLEVFLAGTAGANNEILTATGKEGEVASESNLLFDGSTLAVTGDLTISTDLAIAHGGTGASTAQTAIDALTAVSGASAGEVLTKDGSGNATWVANPLGTVTSVGTTGTVNGVTLTGTVTTSGNLTLGGTLAINNGDWSGTDLSVANGGTGASTLTDGGILLGSGTGAITAMAALADGEMIVGDGSTDPVAESGATLRTSIGVSRGETIILACSDETTALTTGTAKLTFRMPYAFTLVAAGVRASVTTAPVGSVLTVDINEGGSTILSTKLTIDAGEKTSTSAAAAAVISDTALADDAEITIDIDTVGSGTAGAGLKVSLIGYQTTPV